MHITSLPDRRGIGTLGDCAFQFVDFLAETGQKYWQILPTGIAGAGNSPYASTSSFAGNINLIDLDILESEGLLEAAEYVNIDWGTNPSAVDYGKIGNNRMSVLGKAARRFDDRNVAYTWFCEANAYWLDDFALFMAIKESQGMRGLETWPEEYRKRDRLALAAFSKENEERIKFYKKTQFFFYKQATALKAYANRNKIKLIGDMPFYTAYDSADVWAHPGQFLLDKNLFPVEVAGVPPDAFSEDGQLWGNPLYDFEEMETDNFDWWRKRMTYLLTLFDVIRIDHFRAFESFYAIPSGSKDAKTGIWKKGPGMKLFESLNLDKSKIIAEDLGMIDDEVRKLVKTTGFRGMKVLEFAFGGGKTNEYLPKNYKDKNCVVYTGTHDNDTVRGWYSNLGVKEKLRVIRHLPYALFMKKSKALIRCAMESKAELAIIPIQDYLDLDSSARMNIPGTSSGNWEWRIDKGYHTPQLVEYIRSFLKYRKDEDRNQQ
jgi:4-alpha-glucanotransferase